MRLPAFLDARLQFPDPNTADSSGLVAVGGDLSAERMRLAYRSGIFPWTVKPISWWSPNPRAIFDLENFHVPRRLAKLLHQKPFPITRDTAFRKVMECCAAPARGREETWVTPEFIEAYGRLHAEGDAHSLECWHDGELVGGIYGVSFGGFFAGESMFHTEPNASKVALCHLVEHLRSRGFALFDIQMVTPATKQFEPIEIPRAEYLNRIKTAIEMDCSF